MTIQQLNYCITIAEKKSLNKAAEELYITQPSLTSSVKELEKELGITIFHRSSKGVTLTTDGEEFLAYARLIWQQYESVMERYGSLGEVKKKFGVSTQHYSFAVQAFVEMVKQFNPDEFEFSIRETMTRQVVTDVAHSKSEIGILYLSDFNRSVIGKLLEANELIFHPLANCSACVYLYKDHPLAKKKSISFSELQDYPCLMFEQGADSSFYYAEEILSNKDYRRIIRAQDRATMLNLMVGLNGYTLCSGVISEDLNGSSYLAIPFEPDEDYQNSVMEIGYITRKNMILSEAGELYLKELRKYLGIPEENTAGKKKTTAVKK